MSLKEENLIRNNKNYETIQCNKDGVKFKTKKMQRYNDEFLACTQEYEEKQKTVVDEVLRIASINIYICNFI